MKRLAVLITAGALLLGGFVAATPAQASVAGPPCSGPTCFGKSPYKLVNREGASCHDDAYQVRDPRTRSGIAVASPDGGAFEGAVLWYSPSCSANWVEVDGGSPCGQAGLWKVEEADGRIQPAPGDGHYYTLMIDGTGPARAWMYGACVLDARWFSSNWN